MAGKRPWFRIHLSTACLMMLVAALLAWANTDAYKIKDPEPSVRWGSGPGAEAMWDLRYRTFGWPKPALQFRFQFDGPPFDPLLEMGEFKITERPTVRFSGMLIDFIVGLAILAATAFGCEWVVRKRVRRRETPG